MIVKVSGKYRYDIPEHTEQGLEMYELEFEVGDGYRPGPILVKVQELLKAKDPRFDSLKTHLIEVVSHFMKESDAGK